VLFRFGMATLISLVWLCTRNRAIATWPLMAAALGVFGKRLCRTVAFARHYGHLAISSASALCQPLLEWIFLSKGLVKQEVKDGVR